MPEEKQNTNTELNNDQIRASLEQVIAAQVVIGYQSQKKQKNEHTYTRKDIERFVDETVMFTDDFGRGEANSIKKSYAYLLSSIPSWQQNLVMEGRNPIYFGNGQTINNLNGRLNGGSNNIVGGFFTLKIFNSDPILDANRVYVSVDSSRPILSVISHEKGHQFDWDKENGFFSDNSDLWKKALAQERAKGWNGEKVLEEALGKHAPDRTISKHLTFNYKPHEFACEAMAEMTAIYNKVYFQYGGNIEKTNALMEKAYPKLFPVYRDEFIPHAVKKAHDLSKNADIEEKKPRPYQIKQTVKFFSDILPTNMDNLAIAGIAAVTIPIWLKIKGESNVQAINAGLETGAEVSGLAAAGRALNAGREGNAKEAAIQAVDALGIPVVAAREGMADMKETIGRQVAFGKSLKPFLPKTVADAKLLERIIKDPKVKDMLKAHANVLSLKEQSGMDSLNPDIHLRLNAAENKFSKIFSAAREDPELGKQMLSELEKGRKVMDELKQAEKTPRQPSKFIPYGTAIPKQAGITPG